jgi:predicted AlkP superfamily phosphohydrolase/phosphomutase
MAAVKRRTPQAVKRVYHGHLPDTARMRLAQPTMVPVLDWSQTRAFALPTDQNGWIRVNLAGRERDGIVAPDRYEAVCDEIEAAIRGLADEDGRPLAEHVLRPATGGAPPAVLPDVVVHWGEPATANPLRVRGLGVESWAEFPRFTGQHSFEGFCIAHGVDEELGDSIRTEHLHRIMLAGATAEAAPTGGATAG